MKARFINYRREFVVENDSYPTDYQIYKKVSDLILGLDAELVSVSWKLSGLSAMNNSEQETRQV